MKERQLTQGEITLAKRVFKDSLDYKKIRIHRGKYIFFQPDNSGMTPNGEIYVHGIYRSNYAASQLELQGFFIHEMAHVWQYQLDVLNPVAAAIWESLKHGFQYDDTYIYKLAKGKDLLDYAIEQQASIIEDYTLLKHLGVKPITERIENSLEEIRKEKLYERVLARFIANPGYARRVRKCTTMRHGPPHRRRRICRMVPAK